MGTSVQKSRNQPVFIDAFAGCGGLSLGLLRSGWRGIFAIEKDAFAFDTLKSNLIDRGARLRYDWPKWLEQQPWTIESLMDAHGPRLSALRGQIDLLAGGPPCQGFSSAGRRRQGDPRNELVERYLEFVELVRPKMVLIENVRGITYDFVDDDDRVPPRNFAAELIVRLGLRYHVYKDTVRCSEYGVPQQRPRFFLIGMLKTEMRELPSPDAPFARLRSAKARFLAERGLRSRVSCKQAISDLFPRRLGKPCCV
jgi:DNA (cytosine-5)-methyltransferase 1